MSLSSLRPPLAAHRPVRRRTHPPPCLPPSAPSALSRRACASLLLSPLLLCLSAAAAEEEDDDAAAAQMQSVLAQQPALGGSQTLCAAFDGLQLCTTLPAAWRLGEQRTGLSQGEGWAASGWDGLSDPVIGKLADELYFRVRPAPAGFRSVADFGSQAEVLPTVAFGLQSALPELARADITRAGARRGEEAVTIKSASGAPGEPSPAGSEAEAPLFYEWELAVPPESCASNVGCNSAAVYFLSVTLLQGCLCTFALRLSDEGAYRSSADALRAVRRSFSAAPFSAQQRLAQAQAKAPPAAPAVIAAAP